MDKSHGSRATDAPRNKIDARAGPPIEERCRILSNSRSLERITTESTFIRAQSYDCTIGLYALAYFRIAARGIYLVVGAQDLRGRIDFVSIDRKTRSQISRTIAPRSIIALVSGR